MTVFLLFSAFFAAEPTRPINGRVFLTADGFCQSFLSAKEDSTNTIYEPDPMGYEVNLASGTVRRVECRAVPVNPYVLEEVKR